MQDKTSTISTNIPCGLYVLKHKDFDVAMVDIDNYQLDATDWGRTLLEGLELL